MPVLKAAIKYLHRPLVALRGTLKIDQMCFGNDTWTRKKFLSVLRKRNMAGFVAGSEETGNEILGFAICEVRRNSVRIRRLAVHPDHQKKGVGTSLIEIAKRKLSNEITDQDHIGVEVPETNLKALYFFRGRRFLAEGLLKGEKRDDIYMTWYVPDSDSEPRPQPQPQRSEVSNGPTDEGPGPGVRSGVQARKRRSGTKPGDGTDLPSVA